MKNKIVCIINKIVFEKKRKFLSNRNNGVGISQL